MASSWEPSRLTGCRTPVPLGGAPSPTNGDSSSMCKSEETATVIAWKNAKDTYRKSLSEKNFKRVIVPAGPEDVLDEIDGWQRRQSASRCTKVAGGIQACIAGIQKFSNSIDIIAQGSPSPACLLWGSVKFVLTVGDVPLPFL